MPPRPKLRTRLAIVILAESPMPPRTTLFSPASAVVVDTGGVLSHCAIVSREYRIPCVVGTIVGTAVIQDGMRLTVDSSRGIVPIDSRQADSLLCLGIQALTGLT